MLPALPRRETRQGLFPEIQNHKIYEDIINHAAGGCGRPRGYNRRRFGLRRGFRVFLPGVRQGRGKYVEQTDTRRS